MKAGESVMVSGVVGMEKEEEEEEEVTGAISWERVSRPRRRPEYVLAESLALVEVGTLREYDSSMPIAGGAMVESTTEISTTKELSRLVELRKTVLDCGTTQLVLGPVGQIQLL